MNVFELYAKLGLDSSEYEKGLNKAKSEGSSFSSGLKSAAKIGLSAVTAATGAVTAFAASSVQAGMDFDSSMSQVAATMGKSVDEIDNLRNFAQEMGKTTAFSATEAADALNYMALAGYDADTSMEMLPNVLNLAAAGSIDLARASDMVTDTQTAFGMSLERTSQMVDEMAKAASTGNTSVEQLGDAFLTVGGLAQELNGGFVTLDDGTQVAVDGVQELEIALTAMANAGIKGSEAGTHMRNMLTKLSSPSSDGTKALEAMGVAVFDTEGNMRSLSDVFGDLSDAMGEMTQEQKIQTITDLFNARDISSAEAMLNAVNQDWDQIGASIIDASGAASQMAETQLDNLAGDVTLFQSALEGAKIAISDSLNSPLRDFVQFGTEGISKLTSAFKEGGLTGAMEALGEILSDGINMLVSKAPELINAGMELIDALVTGIMDNSSAILNAAVEILGNLISKISEKLPDLVNDLSGLIVLLANSLAEFLPEIFPVILDAVIGIVNNLLANLPTILQALLGLVTSIVDSLVNVGIPALLDALPDIIDGIIGFIDSAIPQLINAVIKIVTTIVQKLPEIIKKIVNVLPKLIGGIVKSLITNIPILINGVVQLISAIVLALPDIITSIIEAIPELIVSVVNAIVEALPMLIDAVISIVMGIVEALPTIIQTIVLAIPEIVNSVVLAIVEAIPQLIDAVISIVLAIVNAFPTIISALIVAIPNVIDSIITAIIDCIPQIVEAGITLFVSLIKELPKIIIEIVKAIPQIIWAIIQAIGGMFKAIGESGKNLFLNFIHGFVNFGMRIGEAIGKIWKAIKNGLVALIDKIKEIGGNILQGLIDGIKEKITAVGDTIKEVAGTIADGFKDFFGIASPSKLFKQYGKFLDEGLAIGIEDNADLVNDAFDDSFDFSSSIAGVTNLAKNDTMGMSNQNMGAVIGLLKQIADKEVVSISPDADGIFNLVREREKIFKTATGYV